MLDTFPNNQTSDTRRQSPRLGWEGNNLTFTKIVPAAPPVARFGEVFVFFENRPYMDHGKAIRVEIGGVPEAPEFFENSEKKNSEFSKNSGASGQTRRGAPPPQSSRAADLVSKKSKTVKIHQD